MPNRKQFWTPEEMRQEDFISCQIWRAMLAHGQPATRHDPIFKPMGGSGAVSPSLWRLEAEGWIERTGRIPVERRRKPFVAWRALEERGKPRVVVPTKPAAAKRKLTRCVKIAEEARRSGLVYRMGQALRDLEKELREIRDGL